MIVIFKISEITEEQNNKISDILNKEYHCGSVVLSSELDWDRLEDKNDITKIIFVKSKDPSKMPSSKVLVDIFSSHLVDILWMDSEGKITNYDPFSSEKSSILFIFPGPILPLSMGSHQRAFNVLYNLRRKNIGVDILISTNKNIDKDKLKNALSCVSSNVYFYRDRRKHLPRTKKVLRWIEQRVRLLTGKSKNLPDLFSERLFQKPTESLKRWVNNLYIAKSYDSVIVSYAWMLPSVQYIELSREHYNLICDLHDVQFYRNKGILSRKERLFFNQNKEKEMEINCLNQCDYLLAISEADKNILRSNVSSEIIDAYPGFDYALAPIRQRPVGKPIHFGFIGGKMEANVLTLEYIIRNWWPVIRKHSPDSKLFVAGTICNVPSIVEASFFDDNIVRLGFVKNIEQFYSMFEVALNPVMVTGGLNFKSIESVMKGKHLFTNETGIKCLSNEFPCYVIRETSELTYYMDKIEFDYQKDKYIRSENQKKILTLFSDDIFIKNLSTVINFES